MTPPIPCERAVLVTWFCEMVQGGLAGVASTFAGPSIKIYKDRSKYNEWEFVLDLKQGLLPGQQQTGMGGPGGGGPGRGGPGLGGPGTGGPGVGGPGMGGPGMGGPPPPIRQ